MVQNHPKGPKTITVEDVMRDIEARCRPATSAHLEIVKFYTG